MSTQIPGKALLLANYGTTVFRATATIPATTTQTLFTVTGGRIIVTNLTGLVTTVIGAVATNLLVNYLNTASGTNSNLSTNVAITSAPVGSQYSVSSLAGAGTVGIAVAQGNEFIVSAGSIRATTDATTTGSMSWVISYIPLDTGAYVTAA
jgi:hypothetical protein